MPSKKYLIWTLLDNENTISLVSSLDMCRRLVLAAVLILAFETPVAAQTSEAWTEFKSAPQCFAISFPGLPRISSELQGTKETPVTQYDFTVDLGDRFFQVSVSEFPLNWDWDDKAAVYAKAINLFSRSTNSRIRKQTSSIIAGQNGIEAVLDGIEHTSLLNVTTLGNHIYMLAATGPNGFETSAESRRFRDSFRLLRLTPLSASNSEKSEWIEYKSSEHGFIVAFPGKPAISSKHTEGEGTQYLHNFLLDSQGDRGFVVLLVEFDAEIQGINDATYASAIGFYARGSGSKTIKEIFTMVGGYRAAEATLYNAEKDVSSLLDIIIVGRQIYMIGSGGRKGHDVSGEARHFRDSFHLLK